jgi:hypothetical protein
VQTADIISLTFKHYLANRVLPSASGNGVIFDRIYQVISSADIIYRYQNHALRETDINLAVRQTQLALFSCISNQEIV